MLNKILTESFLKDEIFSKIRKKHIITLFVIIVAWLAFDKSFFYANPGYKYHVRTIFGNERIVDQTGYSFYGFGRYNAWKETIAIATGGKTNLQNTENDKDSTINVGGIRVMFLDQVDASVDATVRFRLPSKSEDFMKLVEDYRNPLNFVSTSLIPAFKETLQSTASLMTAEEFYSGGRSEFSNQFEDQMKNGIYIVKRVQEKKSKEISPKIKTANASLESQEEMRDNFKNVYIVEKQTNSEGNLIRKTQSFLKDYAVVNIESRVTGVVPNRKFIERMTLKQKASADRAIAREQRIQEDERKQLEISKGEREVATKQAEAKVIQIEKTTNAETEKQLAITNASKLKEEAKIAKETAKLNFEKARIEAKTIKLLADAEAYKKRQIIKADNALKDKLATYEVVMKQAFEAYSKRPVPQIVFGGSGKESNGADINSFMQIMMTKALKDLDLNMAIKKK